MEKKFKKYSAKDILWYMALSALHFVFIKAAYLYIYVLQVLWIHQSYDIKLDSLLSQGSESLS